MALQERIYSVLVVSTAEKTNGALRSLLPASTFQPVRFVSSVSAAKRVWSEQRFDYVIINAPLSDDEGFRFAIDLENAQGTIVLLMVRSEVYEEVLATAIAHGVFVLAKPFSRATLLLALDWMASARERIRKLEKKTLSVEERMEEIRIVNRAKWLLISELKMEEPQAHRYIEKQAMDRSITRKEVAEEIIKTYH